MTQTPRTFPVAGGAIQLTPYDQGGIALEIDNEDGVVGFIAVTADELRQMGAAFIAFADGEEA